jgi:ribosomal protein L11 methyltransferase
VSFTKLEVECPPDFSEILIAELAEAGFGMFMETESGFEADAETHLVNLDAVNQIRQKYGQLQPLEFRLSSVEKENWNELWEKNVSPTVVDDRCLIRAAFHPPGHGYLYEIVITPKMSFGTGHHPTTYLMIKAQLDLDHGGKRVMDAGCGTAILSVMASLRGASEVEAFDIDAWSLSNGEENAALNHCANIRIRQGTIADFDWPRPFDIILANINRNILLHEMSSYAANLVSGGALVLSGFYVADVDELIERATRLGLTLTAKDDREDWAMLRFTKA